MCMYLFSWLLGCDWNTVIDFRWNIKGNHPRIMIACNAIIALTLCHHCSKYFLCIMTFNYLNNPEWLLLSPFYIWKTWATEDISNFHKVSEPVSSSAGFHPRHLLSLCYNTRAVMLWSWKLNLFKLWQKYTELVWHWAHWMLL